MTNPIKYSTGSETLALKKGNFYIGTGDVGKGPTSTTGYYNGITTPSGGYTIYLNKESNGPSIYTASNDAQLISLTNSIAGTSYTTANECLVYFAGQTDKVCLNRDYEGIVTDGLVFNLDAGFTPSYPKNGTTWYDVGGTNNGTLTNGPTYSTNAGGSISFDGTNDIVNGPSAVTWFTNTSFSIVGWIYPNTSPPTEQVWFAAVGPNGGLRRNMHLRIYSSGSLRFGYYADDLTSPTGIVNFGSWNYVAWTYNYSSDTSKIYHNGTQVATGSQGPFSDTSAAVYVGLWQISQPFKGDIASSLVYNRELSQTEITQNYNAQKGRFGL